MRRLILALILALGLGLAGCGAAQPTTAVTPRADDEVRVEPAEGARAMEPICFEEERCDATDSDCDGAIDEGCEGAREGALEVAMAAAGPASLALILEGPGADAGHAWEAAGACDDATWARTARQTLDALAPGRYRVAVGPGRCPGEEGGTAATVSVSARGRLLGTWNVVVEDEPVDVVRLTVGP